MTARISLIFLCFISFQLIAQEKAPFELSPENAGFIKTLPKVFKYGWIEVPEDYEKPDGRKIHVFYYWRPVKSNKRPVIYYNGGPGASSHMMYKTRTQRIFPRLLAATTLAV